MVFVRTAANNVDVLLGAIAMFACTMPGGKPFVSGFQVVPPSIDLKIPPPLPLNTPFSQGASRDSHKAAYTVCGLLGSICTSLAPTFSSRDNTFSNVLPPLTDR